MSEDGPTLHAHLGPFPTGTTFFALNGRRRPLVPATIIVDVSDTLSLSLAQHKFKLDAATITRLLVAARGGGSASAAAAPSRSSESLGAVAEDALDMLSADCASRVLSLIHRSATLVPDAVCRVCLAVVPTAAVGPANPASWTSISALLQQGRWRQAYTELMLVALGDGRVRDRVLQTLRTRIPAMGAAETGHVDLQLVNATTSQALHSALRRGSQQMLFCVSRCPRVALQLADATPSIVESGGAAFVSLPPACFTHARRNVPTHPSPHPTQHNVRCVAVLHSEPCPAPPCTPPPPPCSGFTHCLPSSLGL